MPSTPAIRLAELSSDALDEEGRGYPRPRLRRRTWFSLNGEWDFAIDEAGNQHGPTDVARNGRIRVPYSPETEASGVALRVCIDGHDVALAKQMGFSGVRKHQKIEDPRFLHWADRLGLAVWEEMPSAYRFTRQSVERLIHEWIDVVERDASHPCIIEWVPANESWGVPNLPDNPRERHYVQALYHLTRTLDPTRPVIGNDGWESVATDIIGIHDYDEHPERLAKRYHADQALPRLLARERPGGRLLVLEGQASTDQPIMLTEFGGIALSTNACGTWGYGRCDTADELVRRYRTLLAAVRQLEVLSGFCYTQFADTDQEANGLLFADRTPKFPLDDIAAATSGRLSMPP